ncbi:TonB-dependent siderophore receptor [Kushneria sp. EE4]
MTREQDYGRRLIQRVALGVATGSVIITGVATAAEQESAAQGETMVVTGTALKVPTPLLETPRSASIVDDEELEQRAVTQYDQALNYRAGAVTAPYGNDAKADWFLFRGFSGEKSTYQDGLRLFREAGYLWWKTEPFGLERVEFLKGPASILYGEAPPGGIVNAVSKRPTEESRGLVELQGGNKGHRQIGIDTSGPLTDRGDVRYRFVGLFREHDWEQRGTDNERVYLAPSLAMDVTDDTTLTLLASYQRDHGTPANVFYLPYGTVNDTPFGKIDRDTDLGDNDNDRLEHRQISIGYELEHQFNDTWSFEQNARFSTLDLLLRTAYPSSITADGRNAVLGLTDRDGSYDATTIDNRLIGNWYGDGIENTLLMGFDYQNLDAEYSSRDAFPYGSIDIFNPGDADFRDREGKTDFDLGKEQYGLYVQDQLRLEDRWILMAGARHDSARVTNRQKGGDNQGYDDSQMSYTGGAMYLGDYGLSPYLSYSESFTPNVGNDLNGSAYDASEGRQWELGVKYAPDWLDGYATAAVFDLKETNTLYPSGGSSSNQGGERHSRGFELEGVGYLTDELQLKAAYTYTDVTVDVSDTQRDQRAGLVPRHQASLWVNYGFDQGALDGLTLGAGARYMGTSVDSPQYSDTAVAAYTVYDAMASYDIDRNWTVQVNAKNLTDKEYISGCEYWCYYGESRSVIGSLKYRW